MATATTQTPSGRLPTVHSPLMACMRRTKPIAAPATSRVGEQLRRDVAYRNQLAAFWQAVGGGERLAAATLPLGMALPVVLADSQRLPEEVPLARGAMLSAAILVFVDTMKELPATLIIRPFNFDTLAVRVYTLASDERLAEASTGALLIVLVGLLPLWVLTRAMRRDQA